MCKIKLDYNNPELLQRFQLSEESPSGLAYRVKIKNSLRNVGEQAGNLRQTQNSKQWLVKFDKKSYLVSRIIWSLFYGNISEDKVIDHIDGNGLNNAITNLRLTTQEINNKNHKKQSNNKTGITGVVYEDDRGRYPRYRAIWQKNGKLYSKSFSVNKYGEAAKELAIHHRESQMLKMRDYTKRHGQ